MTSAGLDSNLTASAKMLGVHQPRPLSTLHVGGDITADGPITATGKLNANGGLGFGTSNQAVRVPAGSTSLLVEAPNQYLMLSSKSGTHVCGNAWWDGTNWQRYDPAQASAVWIAAPSGINYMTSPAGSGVLPLATKMTIDLNGTLISNTGDLKGQSVYAKGGYLHTTDTSNGIVYSDNGHLYLRAASGLVVMDGSGGLQVTSGHTMMSQATGGIGSAGGSEGQLELQNGGSGASKIAFHRVGAYAAYLGIDTDNQWAVGGWSMGAVRYVLITDTQPQTLSNKTLADPKVSGQWNQVSGSYTFPTPSGNLGQWRYIKAWGGTVIIYLTAGSFIFAGSILGSGSYVLANGDSLSCYCDGANWWVV